MAKRTKPTRIVRARIPPVLCDLYAWGADAFEEICTNLLFYEPGLANADRFGRPRQKQYGVDADAERIDGSGIEVVSCKCYKFLEKGDIPAFSNEFLDHWQTHWATKNVRRFILCVACDIRAHERREEIAREKERFKALGVKYEVWGQRRLTHLIRERPAVARAFFDPFDPAAPAPAPVVTTPAASGLGGALYPATAIQHISALQSAVEADVVAQIDRSVTLIREGHIDRAKALLETLLADPIRWSSLGAATQARILRQQSLLALQGGDRARCEELLSSADKLSPTSEPRLRAVMALHDGGIEAALQVLQTPSTKEGAFLRASLLLELPDLAAARTLLDEWSSLKGADPEWHRIAASVACLEGKPADALREIEVAELLAPTWLSIIETGAIVRYAAALSPVLTLRTLSLPAPIAAEFILEDDESQQRLAEAARRFESLAKQQGPDAWRQRLRVWHFATLALMPSRTGEAKAACLSLLDEKPVSAVAAFWALDREYAIDRAALLRTLETQLREQDPPSVEDLQAALACASFAGDFKKARAILKRYSARFIGTRAQDVIDVWTARLVGKGRKTAPVKANEPFERLDAALKIGALSGDYQTAEDFFTSVLDNPTIAFIAARALAGRRQWRIVAAHAETLLRLVGTAEAVRLAAYTWYHDGKFERAVDVLRENLHRFPGKMLPAELQRLQAYAAARRGDLPSALPIASALAQQTGDHKDRALLVDLYISAGDISRAIPLLRDIVGKREWSTQDLMRWVPSVSVEEPEFARTLLNMAIASDPSLTHCESLVNWSWRLGLDRQAAELLGKLRANSAGGDGSRIREATFDEIIDFQKRQQATNAEMGRRYLHGEAPIHVLVSAARVNLAELWAGAFKSAGSDLFIRSGNRAVEFFVEFPCEPLNLHMDITALLTADRLGLLPILKAAGVTLTLPHSLPALLQLLEQEAWPHQPSRLEVMERVLALTSNGDIAVWSGNESPQAGMVAVVFERASANSAQPPEITLAQLAQGLVRRGAITGEEFARLRNDFTSFREQAPAPETSRFATLLFRGNTIDVAVEAGLVDALRAHFAMFVENTHREHTTAEVSALQASIETAGRMRSLRRHIAEHLADGTYQLLPEPAERTENGRQRITLLEAHCALLSELLAVPPCASGSVWVWIDDRFATGFTSANGHPIVSTFELLDFLKHRKVLDERGYYAALDTLRAARAQIVPIRRDEVLYRLQQAPVNDAGVVETPQLRNLRLSFNRLLELEHALDFEPQIVGKDRLPEISCMLESFRLARACLEEFWGRSDWPSERQLAYTDWVWDALRVERFERLPLNGDASHRRRLWRLALEQLLFIGMSAPAYQRGSVVHGTRTDYLNWLQANVAEFNGSGDPEITREVASMLAQTLAKEVLAPAKTDPPDGMSFEQVRAVVLSYVEDLPEGLRTHVYADQEFCEVAAPRVSSVVDMGGLQFESGTFWNALAALKIGETARLQSTTQDEFAVESTEAGFILSGSRRLRINEPEFALLAADRTMRQDFVESQFWLQGDDPALASVIAAMEPAAARMIAIQEARQQLPGGRYERLQDLLAQQPVANFGLDVLEPASASAHVRYLALQLTPAGYIDWQVSAGALIARMGIEEAFIRWSGLPIALPEAFRNAISRMEDSSRLLVLSRLLPARCSPLRRMAVMRAFAPESGEVGAHLDALLAEWDRESKPFQTVLRWSERVWKRDREWHRLPVAARLACVWSHAERVCNLFLAKGVDPNIIIGRFGGFHASGLAQTLPFDRDYEVDIAAPRKMSETVLLMHGLANAFADRPRELLEPHREALVALLTLEAEQGRYPRREVFEDRRFGKNALGSYFGVPLAPWWIHALETDTVPAMTEERREQFRKEMIENFKTDLYSPVSWMHLQMFGFEWLPDSKQVPILELLGELHFPESNIDPDARIVWYGLASIIPYVSPELNSRLKSELLDWARRLSSAHPVQVIDLDEEGPASRHAGLIVEFALDLTRRPTLEQSLEDLAVYLPRVIDAWPPLAGALRRLLERALRESPYNQTESLWKAFVKTRSMR